MRNTQGEIMTKNIQLFTKNIFFNKDKVLLIPYFLKTIYIIYIVNNIIIMY